MYSWIVFHLCIYLSRSLLPLISHMNAHAPYTIASVFAYLSLFVALSLSLSLSLALSLCQSVGQTV